MCYNAYKLDYQVGHLSFCPCGPLHMFVTTKIFVSRGVANGLILHPSFMHHLIKPTKGHACQRAINVLGL